MAELAPNPPQRGARWRSTCATTGRRRCGTAASTPPRPPRGVPKACWCICRPTHRTGCSTTSPRCPPPAAARHRVSPRRFGASSASAPRISRAWQGHGFDLDFTDLFYAGDRTPVADYLREHGWRVTPGPDRGIRRLRTPLRVHDEAPLRDSLAVTAVSPIRERKTHDPTPLNDPRRLLGSGLQRRRHRDVGRRVARVGLTGHPAL